MSVIKNACVATLLASLQVAFAYSASFTAVTIEPVSVRTGATGEIIDSLRVGTIVGVVKVAGDWGQVVYFPLPDRKETRMGWVPLKQLKITVPASSSNSADCEIEYKTGAEVCVSVSDASLNCREDYSGDHYRSCDVALEYDVRTNYSGRSYLDVEVECEVDIRYTGREMSSWRSDSASDDESHSLGAHGKESETMSLSFSFSSYNEVDRVKIDSTQCEIESVDLR